MNLEEEYLRKIVQFFNDPANATLRQEIDTLRAQSPAHEAFFHDVHKLWISSAELKELDTINVMEATARLSAKLKQTPRYIERYEAKEVTVYNWRWALRIAAALIIGAIGYGVYYFRPVEYMTKATPAATHAVISLSDGSKVSLDENTTVKYPKRFRRSERRILLEKGNAFFAVARDREHPFVVQLGKSSVTVLGTQFNITATEQEIHVSVKAGSVRFESDAKDKSVLTAGKGIVYNKVTETVTPVDITNKNADAWLTGELSFTDASLREVITTLEQHYKVQIALNDSIANFKKFNARFKNNELREVLDVLEATYPITIERKNNQIIIKSNR
jgi:ferric-dicitrate binding protein FerR (iron transport regulator)